MPRLRLQLPEKFAALEDWLWGSGELPDSEEDEQYTSAELRGIALLRECMQQALPRLGAGLAPEQLGGQPSSQGSSQGSNGAAATPPTPTAATALAAMGMDSPSQKLAF